ncbi:MAG: crossover junction endodeoxyribonuclease RuvC [Planctomycetota bacterium]
MRVIGIDPGTRHVGYGVVEEQGGAFVRLDGGTIDCVSGDDLAARLVGIHRGLQVVIREWQPAAAAVETVFFGQNSRTAICIGEGRGVALLSAAEAEVEVIGYEPALVKKAICGSGRAGKRQVQEMVRVLLSLPEAPATDHEADALALAICHLRRARLGLPQGRRELPAAVQDALGDQAPPRRRGGRKRSAPRLRRAP